MGLMLSVLVFCVGVAEILDCWHHFLLHLVQPQYNPLPHHLDLKSDYLSDQELLHPISESRRTSNVDICWPKDLTAEDNLHVIKKRQHGEINRESPHHTGRKHLHHEKDISSLQKSADSIEGLSPNIVVHSADQADFDASPSVSRDSSPNKLELGVIVESDSSSEVDEPSQIENLNYKKENNYEYVEQDEEISDLCHDRMIYKNGTEGNSIPRPNCPSAMILEECDDVSVQSVADVEEKFESETSSLPDLPVFTENIISQDVTRVSVHYPTKTETSNLDPATCGVKERSDPKAENLNLRSKPEPSEVKSETVLNNNEGLPPLSTIPDEDLEPISEYPEIKVLESSPVPQADESDSSLDTSDASWLVRSKTSDRPLIIRFDTSPEKLQQDFQSVIQTDLRALGDKKANGRSEPLIKKDSVDIYYDALGYQNGDESQGIFERENSALENTNRSGNIENCEGPNGADVKPSSVNLIQIDSNSSSSSLSGIPPLPEDNFESPSPLGLATDNCFSQMTDVLSTEMSHFQSETAALATSITSKNNRSENFQQGSFATDNLKAELAPEGQSGKRPNGNANENVSRDTDLAQESYNENVKPLETLDSENVQNTNYSSDSVKVDPPAAISQQSSLLPNRDSSDHFKTDSREPGTFPSSQETDLRVKKSDIVPKKTDTLSSPITEVDSGNSKSSIKLMDTNVPANTNKKDNKNIPTDCVSHSSLELEAVASSSIKNSDVPNIPISPQETPKPVELKKEMLLPPKANSTKKQKTKSPSKSSSTESSDTVVLCKAKQSDEEIRAENRAHNVTVKTKEPNDAKSEAQAQAGPSKPEEVRPSTSKSDEDKSFWLIFSGEYTKAMNKDWHSGHFCCWQCDESLTGQRYVLRDEHPYCVKCYESVFANGCEECNKIIGIDSKDLSYKDKHWHEACFLCNKCRVSLVDKQFGSKLDKIFCGTCYDQQFASRCDGCGQIFKAGTKKMEYKTRQWHEPCFACCVCKSPIGTKSFIPREQEIYCATCYEEKFATRCVKCNKIITSGGVTYKNEPWHRECFTCTHCNTSLAGQRFTSRDEKPYCAECFGELFAKRCTACSKPITGIGGTRFISFEDRHWHNDCFICASCKTSLVGRGFITDGDDIICPECAKQKLM